MPQFTKAVESKQVAQQEAERARFVVEKAKQVRVLAGRAPCKPCPPPPSRPCRALGPGPWQLVG